MKNITIILILFFSISCCSNKSNGNPDIQVKATLIRSYDSINSRVKNDKFKAFDIKISIINKSDKRISFWIMTSSWDENFIINNDYIEFYMPSCNHNFPDVKHIGANDSLIYKTTFRKINNTLGENVKSTRFGFIFIDSLKCPNMDIYLNIINDKSKHDRIIWSNPLYLNTDK